MSLPQYTKHFANLAKHGDRALELLVVPTPHSEHPLRCLLFVAADGGRVVATMAAARLCGALRDLLDDMDEAGPEGHITASSFAAQAHIKGAAEGNHSTHSTPQRPKGAREEPEEPIATAPIPTVLTASALAALSPLQRQQSLDAAVADLPVFELPVAEASAVECAMDYASLCLRFGPSAALARPLAAPLQQLVGAWEYDFIKAAAFTPVPPPRLSASALVAALLRRRPGGGSQAAMPSVPSNADVEEEAEEPAPNPAVVRPVQEAESLVARHPPHEAASTQQVPEVVPPHTLAPLMALMRVADFLAFDGLRDLACAFLSSLVMGKSPAEVATLFGMARPLDDDELAPVFRTHPFLRPPTPPGNESLPAPLAQSSSTA